MRFLAFIFSAIFVLPVWASSPSDLRTIGESSPIQLYLFTSLTCSHCADFHKNILPILKKEYADKGKAQIIIVNTIRSQNDLTAVQIVRCLNNKSSEKLEDELYSKQSKWVREDAPKAQKIIASYAAKRGMSQNDFNLCLTDSGLQKTILEQQANLAGLYGVNATPTLVMRDGSDVSKWSGTGKKEILNGLKEAFQK